MKYQHFNDLSAAEYERLKADIAEKGVLVPVDVDEEGDTLDGHQRRRICAELHIECPIRLVEGLSPDEKHAYSIAVNAFRRHLTGVEKAQAINKLRSLGWSVRRIAEATGLPKSSVHRDLPGVPSGTPGPVRPETVEGLDGRRYPATRPKASSGNGGSLDREAVGSGDDESGVSAPAPSPTPNPVHDLEQTFADRHPDYESDGSIVYVQMRLVDMTLPQLVDHHAKLARQRDTLSVEVRLLADLIEVMRADPNLATAGDALERLGRAA